MDIRKGDVYYNCIIPEDETWEETLARPDFKMIQVKKKLEHGIYSVDLAISKEGRVVAKDGKGTEKEIKHLMEGWPK